MLSLTKIFQFEMAHAIYGYTGACKNIHGHSYELQVTVISGHKIKGYIPGTGFVIDFKELKQLVNSSIIQQLDHKLVLSRKFLEHNPDIRPQENVVIWEAEPSAENILLYIHEILTQQLPINVKLVKLKIYETKDSYAEWVDN